MVAEELFFGEATTGVAADLQAATTMAAKMVGSLGMGGTLFSYDAVDRPEANIVAKVLSTDDGRERVERVLDQARSEVRQMLGRNRDWSRPCATPCWSTTS